jgi:hypothetical protein
MLYKQILVTVIFCSVTMSTHTMGLDENKSKSRSRKIRSAIQTLLRNSDVDVNTDWIPYGSSWIPGPPLFLAIQHCTDLVPVLLRRGASSNMRYESRTPLHCAEDPRTAVTLIKAGAHVNPAATIEDDNGSLEKIYDSPLTWMAISRNRNDAMYQAMHTLLRHGADPNLYFTRSKDTALSWEIRRLLKCKSRKNGVISLRTLDMLLYHGADPYQHDSVLSLAIEEDRKLAHHLVKARRRWVNWLADTLQQWDVGNGKFLPLELALKIAMERYRYPSDDHEKNYVEILDEENAVFSSVHNGALKRQKINPGEG